MEQLKQFEVEKKVAVDNLLELKAILQQLDGVGIDAKQDLEKIESALNSIHEDVLRIALLGAFSDGKTSVIAAWLGKVMADMNIDMDESSDKLAVYRPEGLPERCEIIDTPGLFGDKHKRSDDELIQYEDITRKYISEAHLVLYVVDATNPLKDSHSESIQWILRDLNKLKSTVFVINKMDEVTDLTDSVLFEEQAEIKTLNLQQKLQKRANLTEEEVEALNIVCISSNPNGRGLPFWFEKPDVYQARSRVKNLKEKTASILEGSVRSEIIAKTGIDVVTSLVKERVDEAQMYIEKLNVFAAQREQESERIGEDIQKGRQEVKRLGRELHRELDVYEKQLLGKLRALSLEDIRPFMEDEIGYHEDQVGYKLGTKIKTIVDFYYDQTELVTSRIDKEISSQLDSSESFLNSLGGNAVSMTTTGLGRLAQANPAVIKDTIFAARDMLGKATGYVFKFKPWGATKLAGQITRWAGPVGIGISLVSEAYDAYKKHELEVELENTKSEIASMIKEAFKDIYDILAEDQKLFEFFAPQLETFQKLMDTVDNQVRDIRASQESIELIQHKLHGMKQYSLPS